MFFVVPLFFRSCYLFLLKINIEEKIKKVNKNVILIYKIY
nr:MAG TPA: hypothetical protein [Caudoviricetes sp.]